MAIAWKAAQVAFQKAQAKQKYCYDRHKKAAPPCVAEGDWVMLYVPSENNGKAYKFSRPFCGPYQVIRVFLNGVELILISKPAASSIRVSLDRVRHCPVAGVYELERDASELMETADDSGAEDNDAQQTGINTDVESEEEEIPRQSQ